MSRFVFDDPRVEERHLQFDFEDELRRLDERTQYLNHSDNDAQVCKFYASGSCKRENCAFKHTKSDKSVVCKHWLRSLCKKDDTCDFLHRYDLTKMPECFFFTKHNGECNYGPECPFLHIDPESKMTECPWYARGFCKHGPKCRHKHVKRPRICEDYFLGFCIQGPNCVYGHPKYETPKEFTSQRQAAAVNLSQSVMEVSSNYKV